MMTYAQVISFFQDKRDAPCEVTDKLINSGFQQEKGTGYLKIAEVSEIEKPTQWWHLINFCLGKYEKHKENDTYRYTPCGELLFWMAEVSKAVNKCELEKLANEIINDKAMSRRLANKKITELCWEKINETVEKR